MSNLAKGNAVVGQSGGPTVVINQSLVGVIEEVKEQECFGELLGALHGVRGVIDGKFVDLRKVSRHDLDDIAQTPAAALGSTRDKPDLEYCNRILEVFQKREVRYFFYIGGNDSASTANIVNDLAQQAGYELKVIHIPKTIDNDLLVTDHCPGFGSAATFVIHALIGDDLEGPTGGTIPEFGVQLNDPSGVPAVGVPVYFRIEGDGQKAKLGKKRVVTDAEGRAVTWLKLGDKTDQYFVAVEVQDERSDIPKDARFHIRPFEFVAMATNKTQMFIAGSPSGHCGCSPPS